MNDRFGVKRALDRVGDMPKEHRLPALLTLEKECQCLEKNLAVDLKATALDVRGVRELASSIRTAIKKERRR